MDAAVLAAFVREGPAALAFLEQANALRLSILEGYPDYYLDRPGAKPGGGRALDNDLFGFKELGDWADKVFNDGMIQRMMLRETPLGGASGFIDPAEMQRRADEDLRGFGQALIGRLLRACRRRLRRLAVRFHGRCVMSLRSFRASGLVIDRCLGVILLSRRLG